MDVILHLNIYRRLMLKYFFPRQQCLYDIMTMQSAVLAGTCLFPIILFIIHLTFLVMSCKIPKDTAQSLLIPRST